MSDIKNHLKTMSDINQNHNYPNSPINKNLNNYYNSEKNNPAINNNSNQNILNNIQQNHINIINIPKKNFLFLWGKRYNKKKYKTTYVYKACS